MRLTETNILKKEEKVVCIDDRCCISKELDHIFRVRFHNVRTGELLTFVVRFDGDCPSATIRTYLDVHGRQTWDVMSWRAKSCISMYGFFEVEDDDFRVLSLLVTDKIDDYIVENLIEA